MYRKFERKPMVWETCQVTVRGQVMLGLQPAYPTLTNLVKQTNTYSIQLLITIHISYTCCCSSFPLCFSKNSRLSRTYLGLPRIALGTTQDLQELLISHSTLTPKCILATFRQACSWTCSIKVKGGGWYIPTFEINLVSGFLPVSLSSSTPTPPYCLLGKIDLTQH